LYHGEELDGLNYQDLSTPVPLYSGMDLDEIRIKIHEFRIIGIGDWDPLMLPLVQQRRQLRLEPIMQQDEFMSPKRKIGRIATMVHAYLHTH
jgi:hypothetical protein